MKLRKRSVVTNIALLLIIVIVYAASFGFASPSQGLALKGCTGGSNVALQIAVTDSSDVEAYMDALDRADAHGTFFFCEQCCKNVESLIGEVIARGHSVGYYVCTEHEGGDSDMYIGNGYSVPVMSYDDGRNMRHIGPSIDFEKLKKQENWPQLLRDNIFGDMFIRIEADNKIDEFEKVVQIVRDKGYTILKVEEML